MSDRPAGFGPGYDLVDDSTPEPADVPDDLPDDAPPIDPFGEGGPPAPVDLLERRDPSSVAEALDLYTRLGALSKWVNARKGDVHGWAERLAESRRAEDGASLKWAMDDGTVLQTNPKPTPTIADREAFARWYVTGVLDADPDRDPDAMIQFDDRVMRRRTVEIRDRSKLLGLLNDLARLYADPSDEATEEEHSLDVLGILTAALDVDDEWLVGEAILDDLLAGKLRPTADGDPRIVLDVDRQAVVDPSTGELIPGVRVRPPAARQVQIRPTPAAKARVESELRELLGPPELGG